MIKALNLLGLFTVRLLDRAKGTVVNIGRNNIRRDDFTSLQIIIDDLAAHELICKTRDYNGETEVLKHLQRWRSGMTIDFFGDGAAEEAQKFTSLLDSLKAEDIKRELCMQVYYTNAITNVKLLTGEQFSERVQLQVNIEYLTELSENVLRIDTLQFELDSE